MISTFSFHLTLIASSKFPFYNVSQKTIALSNAQNILIFFAYRKDFQIEQTLEWSPEGRDKSSVSVNTKTPKTTVALPQP